MDSRSTSAIAAIIFGLASVAFVRVAARAGISYRLICLLPITTAWGVYLAFALQTGDLSYIKEPIAVTLLAPIGFYAWSRLEVRTRRMVNNYRGVDPPAELACEIEPNGGSDSG